MILISEEPHQFEKGVKCTMSTKPAAVCSGFVPGMVRPTRCKKCFGDISDHKPKEPIQRRKSIKEGNDMAKNGPRSRENSLVVQSADNGGNDNGGTMLNLVLNYFRSFFP